MSNSGNLELTWGDLKVCCGDGSVRVWLGRKCLITLGDSPQVKLIDIIRRGKARKAQLPVDVNVCWEIARQEFGC